MATHSSILAWRIPQTEEPGGLQSKGSQSIRQDCRDLAHMHRVNINRRNFNKLKRKPPLSMLVPGYQELQCNKRIDSLRNLRATESLIINVSQPQARAK